MWQCTSSLFIYDKPMMGYVAPDPISSGGLCMITQYTLVTPMAALTGAP